MPGIVGPVIYSHYAYCGSYAGISNDKRYNKIM